MKVKKKETYVGFYACILEFYKKAYKSLKKSTWKANK